MTADVRTELQARIEALSASERVALACALDIPLTESRSELVGYLTCPGVKPKVDDLRALARSRLPEYMVPHRFVFLEAMPRTPAGKVDRRALSRLGDEGAPSTSHVPDAPGELIGPRNEAERILAEIWQKVLDVDEVDVHDDFFELGGDSILSIRIISRANQAGLAITPQQFFESPTIADLAAAAGDPKESS